VPLDKDLALELDRIYEVMAMPDRVEGMHAFVEKRKPIPCREHRGGQNHNDRIAA
jgi:hypothetical protein